MMYIGLGYPTEDELTKFTLGASVGVMASLQPVYSNDISVTYCRCKSAIKTIENEWVHGKNNNLAHSHVRRKQAVDCKLKSVGFVIRPPSSRC